MVGQEPSISASLVLSSIDQVEQRTVMSIKYNRAKHRDTTETKTAI